MKKYIPVLLSAVLFSAASGSFGRTPWMRRYPDVSWRYLERWERDHTWLAPLREGRRLFYEGELDVALDHLREASAEQEEDGRLHYEIGYIHFARADVEAAESRLRRAEELLSPVMPPHEYLFNARYLLGRIAEADGRLDEALMRYRAALELAPEEAALHYRRGMIKYHLGRREEARAVLLRSLELDRRLGSAEYLLGLISLEAGDLEAASVRFRNALELGAEEAASLFCLGEIAARREDWEAAISYFEASLARDPGLTAARIALANTFYQKGDLDAAADEFRRLSESEPRQARWVYNLGVIERERGREAAAGEYFRRALEISPDLDFYYRPGEDTEALSSAAHREYERGDFRRAIELYREALLRDPFYLPARFNLARTYQADNQNSRARREYERLLRVDPDHISTHLNLGIAIYQQDRRSPRAAYHLRKYLELNPQSRQAHLVRRYLREIRGW